MQKVSLECQANLCIDVYFKGRIGSVEREAILGMWPADGELDFCFFGGKMKYRNKT